MTASLKALIIDGRVHELGDFGVYHPDLVVRDVSNIEGIAIGWTVDANGIFAAPVIAPPSVEDLVAYARAKRYAIEVGGINIGGISIATDDRSKTLLMGARLRAEKDGALTEDVAAADGSTHTLTAQEIIAISDAIGAHVSACFKAQAEIIKSIMAKNPVTTTFTEIDAAAWPQAKT